MLAAPDTGADLAYAGSMFIVTDQAAAVPEYKKTIVAGSAGDIVYPDFFTGVKGNYLRPGIVAAGMAPNALGDPGAGSGSLEFLNSGQVKAWRDIRVRGTVSAR